MATQTIPGYTFGSSLLERAPITLDEFEKIKKSALFNDEDVKFLKMSYGVLEDQVDDILDVWYGFVAANDFLVYYFTDKATGGPNAEYLNAVRKRFGQWILDTAKAEYDQNWLDYQFEIGRRHHRTSKNKTDSVDSVENINFRYLVPLIIPITATLKPFLEKKGHSAEDVEKMHAAWVKSVVIQVTLWSYPYIKEGDF